MKIISLGIFLIVGLPLAILFTAEFFSPGLPDKVKSDNILKMTPGMTLDQVIDILGKPLSITALHGIHQFDCRRPNPILDIDINEEADIKKIVNEYISNQKYCCNGNKRDLEEFDNVTLVYTKRGFFFSYPMLWVHLDTSFKVHTVFAKEYEGGLLGEDSGIYGCGWAMDSACTRRDYTHTNKWINIEKFYRCFQ